MPQITIDMNEHKGFFESQLGQAVLTEMAKADVMGILAAVVDCKHTSSETIAYIVNRLTVTECNKYNNDDFTFCIIARAAENDKTDTETLDKIYDFATKLIARYQIGSTQYNIAMTIFERLAIHPNTSENNLRKLVADNDRFDRFIVQNSGISDNWLIEIVESSTSQAEKLAAVPELVRRLKAKSQEQSS